MHLYLDDEARKCIIVFFSNEFGFKTIEEINSTLPGVIKKRMYDNPHMLVGILGNLVTKGFLKVKPGRVPKFSKT